MRPNPLFIHSGQVISGVNRGHKLGFPTANLDCSKVTEESSLKYGVYIVTAEINGKKHQGVVNYGIPLTFYEHKPKIDLHLLKYEGNLYGKILTLKFWEKIREVKQFLNEQELIWQIEKDIQYAKNFFGKNKTL